jgi:hypothetical protein
MGLNPSPGSHLAMRSDLSHKGRGETAHTALGVAAIATIHSRATTGTR